MSVSLASAAEKYADWSGGKRVLCGYVRPVSHCDAENLKKPDQDFRRRAYGFSEI